MILSLLLLACKGDEPPDEVEVVPDEIVVRLTNPTDADPFAGVDALRLEITVDGEVVAEDEFEVGEAADLGDVLTYGVVRFRLAGLSGSTVLSYGRSAEVALYPGVELSVPLMFLPINQTLSLTSDEMTSERSGHYTTALADGRILLAGGRTPNGSAGYADLEIYDPSLQSFQPLGDTLPEGLIYPTASWTGDGSELIFAGGGEVTLGDPIPRPVTVSFDPTDLSLDIVDEMNAGRVGHCFHIFRDTFGIAFGGSEEATTADYLRVDEATGIWNWTEVAIDDLDPTQVTGCALSDTGQIFVQGLGPLHTGVFDFTEEAQVRNPEISEAFTAVPAESAGDIVALVGPMLIPIVGGAVWVGGGVIPDGTGTVNEEGNLFLMDSMTFVSAADPAVPRVDGSWDHWMEDGWAVLGCGSPTGDEDDVQTRIELLHLESGDAFPAIELDRLRPECRVNTLPDGAVLVTGGYNAVQSGEASAAVVVPYLEGL